MSDQSLLDADEGVEGNRDNTADAPRALQDDYRKALGLKIQRDFLSPEREKELWACREDPAAKAELMAERTRYKDIAVDTIDRYEGRAQSRDLSLSTPLKTKAGSNSLQDFIAADYGAADERLIERDRQRNAAMMQAALATLDERARTILTKRLMCDDGEESALQDLGNQFGISAERVRQIEGKALKQLRTFMGVEEPQTPKKRMRVSRTKAHSPA